MAPVDYCIVYFSGHPSSGPLYEESDPHSQRCDLVGAVAEEVNFLERESEVDQSSCALLSLVFSPAGSELDIIGLSFTRCGRCRTECPRDTAVGQD